MNVLCKEIQVREKMTPSMLYNLTYLKNKIPQKKRSHLVIREKGWRKKELEEDTNFQLVIW